MIVKILKFQFILHGDADRVSPVEQNKAMYDSIKLHQPNLKIKANFPQQLDIITIFGI